MAGRLEQGIKDWTIRRKILTGFAVVLLLTALLGWQAIQGLGRLTTAVAAGGLSREVTEQMFRDTQLMILTVLAITILCVVIARETAKADLDAEDAAFHTRVRRHPA